MPLTAKLLELVEIGRIGEARGYRVTLEVRRRDPPGRPARLAVDVPIGVGLETRFWSDHPQWRPAGPWAVFFAATRHEVLTAALASEDGTAVIDEPDADACAPPPDEEPTPWPPTGAFTVDEPRPAPRPTPPVIDLDPDAREARKVRIAAALTGIQLAVVLVGGLADKDLAGLGANALMLVLTFLGGLAGCFLGARIIRTDYGYLRTALVKLAAVVVLGPAIGELSRSLLGLPALFAILVSFVAIAWLLAWLFDLDQLEAGVTTVLIIVFQIAAIVTVNVMLWD